MINILLMSYWPYHGLSYILRRINLGKPLTVWHSDLFEDYIISLWSQHNFLHVDAIHCLKSWMVSRCSSFALVLKINTGSNIIIVKLYIIVLCIILHNMKMYQCMSMLWL